MPTGPHYSSIRKFAECADKVLEKNIGYTINEVAEKCSIDYRTVNNYVKLELPEVNKWMSYPKFIVPKEKCVCYDGMVVDPPAQSNRTLLPSFIGVASGSIMFLDGAKRLTEGNRMGVAEMAFGTGIALMSLFI